MTFDIDDCADDFDTANKGDEQDLAHWAMQWGVRLMNAYAVRDTSAVLLKARTETLFAAIAHGDEAHQRWLKLAIENHFAGWSESPAASAAATGPGKAD